MALQPLQRGLHVTIFCIRNRSLARVLLFLPSLGSTLVALQLLREAGLQDPPGRLSN